MTISTSQSQTIALGNGATPTFTFDFVADSAQNIEVIFTDTDGTQTTLAASLYTLVLNAVASGQIWSVGGSVTYPIVGSPIANGTSLTIQRILPFTQVITIANQGDFAPQVIEEMGDTLEMQIQQLVSRTGQMRGTWITGTNYSFGDVVKDGANGGNTGNYYMCAIANTSGVWATDLAAGDWSLVIQANSGAASLPLSVANGGTGITTYSQGDMLYAPSVNILAKLAKNTNATRYLSNQGSSNNASWSLVNLGNGVTGTLAVANGGTGTTASTGSMSVVLNNAPTINTPTFTGTASFINLIDLSNPTAGQIQFPATQNSSANANTLDDYKEQTFTPSISFGSGSALGTFTGFSTKIGRIVTFTMSFTISGTSTPSGVITLGNLPYTSIVTSGSRTAVAVYAASLSASFTGTPCGYVDIATNSVIFQELTAGTISNPGAKIIPGSNFLIAGTYYTT